MQSERIDIRFVRVGDHMTNEFGVSGVVQGRLDCPDEVEVNEFGGILIKRDDGLGHDGNGFALSGDRETDEYWWIYRTPVDSWGERL